MLSSELLKKRILVIGSNGMLGQRLVKFFSTSQNYELMTSSAEPESYFNNLPYKSVDITNKNNVRELILDFFPDYVINAAAFTNVDKSETERETAWKINVNGVENIALYSWTVDANLIHISSDYIFDGKNGPYTEDAKPCPIGYYGRTKLAGENSIRTSGVRFTILRTNVLYGPARFGRPDYVKWVISSLRDKNKIKIVTDQINNPTYIDDLVQAIRKIIEFRKEGIFNVGGKEILSRYDFTLRIADFFSLDKTLIEPILTKDLNQQAARPLKSGLVTLKAETEIGYHPRTIEESFIQMKSELSL